MPGNKVNKKQRVSVGLKPIRSKNGYMLKEAIVKESPIDEQNAMLRRQQEAKRAVIIREAELQEAKNNAAKMAAIGQANIDEAKMLLVAEKSAAAREIKLAKKNLKEAKAMAKRSRPSFTTRLRYGLLEKPFDPTYKPSDEEILIKEGRKKKGVKFSRQ